MALDAIDFDTATAYTDAERAAIAEVEPRFRVNMAGLSAIVGRTTNTLRADLARHGERFPVLARGRNGVDYVFDARAVVEFFRELEEEAEATRRAEEERVKSLRLELLGGDSVDAKSVELSPKDRREIMQAEYFAGQVKRQRGELVRVAEVEDAARLWNARLREGMQSAGARIVEDLSLSRDHARAVERLIDDALRQAAASAGKAFEGFGEGFRDAG